MNGFFSFYAYVFSPWQWVVLIFIPSLLWSEQECTNQSLDIGDTSHLTKQQKIDKLQSALFQSIDKHTICLEKKQNISSGGKAGLSQNGGNGDGVQNQLDTSNIMIDSQYNNSIQGSFTPDSTKKTEENQQNNSLSEAIEPAPKPSEEQTDIRKNPEDIEPPDNDDIVQKLLYEQAMNEKDPVKRKKLWDEYKKYK